MNTSEIKYVKKYPYVVENAVAKYESRYNPETFCNELWQSGHDWYADRYFMTYEEAKHYVDSTESSQSPEARIRSID